MTLTWGGDLKKMIDIVSIQRPDAYLDRQMDTILTGLECLLQPASHGSMLGISAGVPIEDADTIGVFIEEYPQIEKGDFVETSDGVRYRVSDIDTIKGVKATVLHLTTQSVR